MADYFRQCEDGHHCENGSLCQENPNQEGSYYCDCTTAVGGKFAGLYCEYEAESECKFSSDAEASWFCVNKGQCVVASSQWVCDCNNNFEGPVSSYAPFYSRMNHYDFGVTSWIDDCLSVAL
jgi:hypothetical protein